MIAQGRRLASVGVKLAAALALALTAAAFWTDTTAASSVAGQVATWTVVTKDADESVSSSTTVQLDDELTFATTSGGVYEVELALVYASPAGGGVPDLKLFVGEDATNRGVLQWWFANTSDASSTQAVMSNTGNGFPIGTGSAERTVRITGYVVAGGASWNVRWAQNTSSASATVVRAGSLLRYRLIGDYATPGGGGGAVAWGDVTGKPATFPPAEHDHDGRYCLKDGSESDPDCAGGGGGGLSCVDDPDCASIVYVDDAILAAANCGGPDQEPCAVAFPDDGPDRAALVDLRTLGGYALGLGLAGFFAVVFLRTFSRREGDG